jgi:ABC-2 type transport system permease protein
MTNIEGTRGEIYDLGYRNYDGPRLGRRYAVRSLFILSLRNVFGLGRSTLPKVLAFGLTLLAFVPAIGVVIAGAVVGPGEFEILEPHDYYGSIQIIMILFIAAMASDLIGNDRRNNTLALYFSRPINRDDYALAKILALTTSLLALTLLPQILAFIGNWLGATDSTDWFTDNASELAPITISAVMVSALLASLGVLIATYAARRAFALISVIAVFLLSFVATSILVEFLETGWARVVMLASPLYVSRGSTLALFGEVPAMTQHSAAGDPDEQVAFADLPTWVWIVALLAHTTIATLLTVRRYRRAS